MPPGHKRRPARGHSSDPADELALVGTHQLDLGKNVAFGRRLDLGAAGVGSHRQTWLVQRQQSEMVVMCTMALGWARTGVPGLAGPRPRDRNFGRVVSDNRAEATGPFNRLAWKRNDEPEHPETGAADGAERGNDRRGAAAGPRAG